MNIPQELKYSKEHEWVKVEGNIAIVGITDFAQDAMGDIVYAEVPAEGDEFAAGDALANIESVKAVSEVYAPVGGTVVEVNTELEGAPQLLNESAYDAWIAKLENFTGIEALMTADEYAEFLKTEA